MTSIKNDRCYCTIGFSKSTYDRLIKLTHDMKIENRRSNIAIVVNTAVTLFCDEYAKAPKTAMTKVIKHLEA